MAVHSTKHLHASMKKYVKRSMDSVSRALDLNSQGTVLVPSGFVSLHLKKYSGCKLFVDSLFHLFLHTNNKLANNKN